MRSPKKPTHHRVSGVGARHSTHVSTCEDADAAGCRLMSRAEKHAEVLLSPTTCSNGHRRSHRYGCSLLKKHPVDRHPHSCGDVMYHQSRPLFASDHHTVRVRRSRTRDNGHEKERRRDEEEREEKKREKREKKRRKKRGKEKRREEQRGDMRSRQTSNNTTQTDWHLGGWLDSQLEFDITQRPHGRNARCQRNQQ